MFISVSAHLYRFTQPTRPRPLRYHFAGSFESPTPPQLRNLYGLVKAVAISGLALAIPGLTLGIPGLVLDKPGPKRSQPASSYISRTLSCSSLPFHVIPSEAEGPETSAGSYGTDYQQSHASTASIRWLPPSLTGARSSSRTASAVCPHADAGPVSTVGA